MPRTLRVGIACVTLALAVGCASRVALARSNAAQLARLGHRGDSFSGLVDAIEARSGCWVWITSGMRSAGEQARLSREDPRNAQPGTSRHETARAIDLNLVCPTQARMVRKASPRDVWLATGAPAVARARGFSWGGDIPGYYDPVHFQQ